MKRLFLSIALLVTVQAFSQDTLSMYQDTLSNFDEDERNFWPRHFGGTSFDTVRARYKTAAPRADGTIDSLQGFREKGFAVLLKEIVYTVNPHNEKEKKQGADYSVVEFLDENKRPMPKEKIIWDYLLH